MNAYSILEHEKGIFMRHHPLFTAALCGLSLSCPSLLLADIKVETAGGCKVSDSEHPEYYLKIGGQVRLDETWFSGNAASKRADFPSGAYIRLAEIALEGGLAPHTTYNVNFDFNSKNFLGSDAYLEYTGFSNNSSLQVGQVPPPFGLENSNSAKWLPFLERSLPSNAFGGHQGIGVKGSVWTDTLSFTVSALQPKHAAPNTGPGNDRWATNARLVFSPVHEHGQVYHFGLSGRYQTLHTTQAGGAPLLGLILKTGPEAGTRCSTLKPLLNLAAQVSHYTVLTPEFAVLSGPAMLQAEYFDTRGRRADKPGGHAHFSGWHVQGSYILTGESHSYNPVFGTFGQVKPQTDVGAWEIGLRYSTVNLNDKELMGGTENNTTASLSWYVNHNVRILSNYIRANIHAPSQAKRNLNIIGLRLQTVF
jgi:phosphate-selective porin OprO/OprP